MYKELIVLMLNARLIWLNITSSISSSVHGIVTDAVTDTVFQKNVWA